MKCKRFHLVFIIFSLSRKVNKFLGGRINKFIRPYLNSFDKSENSVKKSIDKSLACDYPVVVSASIYVFLFPRRHMFMESEVCI